MFQGNLLPLHAIGSNISNGFTCFSDHKNSRWVTVIFTQCDQSHFMTVSHFFLNLLTWLFLYLKLKEGASCSLQYC